MKKVGRGVENGVGEMGGGGGALLILSLFGHCVKSTAMWFLILLTFG